jgi:hypothetical protein
MTAGPSAEYLKSPSAAVAPAFSAGKGESSEAYPRIVARLTDRLRVVHGQCNLQWLLQARKSPTRWETIAFCATKEGLILRIKEHLQARDSDMILPLKEIAKRCDPEAWAAIEALPEYFPKQAPHRMAGD